MRLLATRKRHTSIAASALPEVESVASSLSTSPGSDNRLTVYKTSGLIDVHTTGSAARVVKRSGERAKIAKDVLLLSLEALAQSADAFPPLKSAVGGLLFLTNQTELVSSNKEQVSNIYAEIDAFAASLVRAIPDATKLSDGHKAAIRALAEDVLAVSSDVNLVAQERRMARFFRAKRHSARLEQLMKRLDQANKAFTRTMLSTVEIQVSEIRNCVLPLRDETANPKVKLNHDNDPDLDSFLYQ